MYFYHLLNVEAGMHQAGGQGGQPPPQILADQKEPPGSGGAPHYYQPPRIFDPWCIPVKYIDSQEFIWAYLKDKREYFISEEYFN